MKIEKQKRRERAMELAISGSSGELTAEDLIERAKAIEAFLGADDDACPGVVLQEAPAFVTRNDLHTALDTVTTDLTRQMGALEDRMIAILGLGGDVDAVGEDADEDDCDCAPLQNAATFGLSVRKISLANFLAGADDNLLPVEELRRQVIQHIGNGNTDQVSDMLANVIDLVFGKATDDAAVRSST